MLIDAHTHVNFHDYKEDMDAVIRRALDAGVWLINVGTQIDTSRSAVDLAQQYETGVYAAVGLHPEHTYHHTVNEEGYEFRTRQEDFDYEAYKALALQPKVVAIGECGLDYYWFKDGEDVEAIKQTQIEVFLRQIELAIGTDKALMIHCRPTKGSMDAYEDILDLVAKAKWQYPELRFQVHCFTGNLSIARQFVELGGYISCSGIITFDKTGQSEEVVKNIPLERLLVETDAPYLAPAPYRGKRNEPAMVEHVARKIAEWKGESFEAVAEVTTANAKLLFRI